MVSHIRLLLIAGSLSLLAPAAAHADTPIASVQKGTSIAAYRGIAAWSAYDSATARYRLMIARNDAITAARTTTSPAPFDLSAGPDASGRTVLTYSRCRSAANCRGFVYDVAAHRQRALAGTRGSVNEPSLWRDRVAWVRPGACPRVYARSGSRVARPISTGSCRQQLSGVDVRGDEVVWSTVDLSAADRSGAGLKTSAIVGYRFGGRVRILRRVTFGEESNLLQSPVLDGGHVFYTHAGLHPPMSFGRVAFTGGRATEVRANIELEGALARDGATTYYEVAGEEDCSQQELSPVPCRIVRSSADPFSTTPRTLPAQLSIGWPGNSGRAHELAIGPVTFSGALTRKVVRGSSVRSIQPVGGVKVALLKRIEHTGRGAEESFRSTGLTTTTAADGSWSIATAVPDFQPFYSVTTVGEAVPTLTRRGTVGSLYAEVEATAAPTTVTSGTTVGFTGTVAPSLSGHPVSIQIRTAHNCQTAVDGAQFCQDAWKTVGTATVAADGSTWAVAVAITQSGVYQAALSAKDGVAGASAPIVITAI